MITSPAPPEPGRETPKADHWRKPQVGAGIKTDRYRVKEGETVDLARWPPEDTTGFHGSEAQALMESRKLTLKLERLQEMLYAEHKHKLLIILQAMDTGGKDGTIKKVFEGVNPQGVRVAHFGPPTAEESDHDFLWRAHTHTPERGEVVIFNRSHYEDVLIARVHGTIKKKECLRRYNDIRHFERLLHEDRTVILKFFLHIDKAEQRRRLEDRLTDPSKQWKFSLADVQERRFWGDYMKAYEDAMQNTSTRSSPWYVVPSNKKWFRDLLVSSTIVERLEELGMAFPRLSVDPESISL
jgi:PPK2 family polyphosphate:nucleotide phosphotransferase